MIKIGKENGLFENLRHLAFEVADVEETVAELAKLGIVCEPIRTDDYTGRKMTFFFDPNGLPYFLSVPPQTRYLF